MFRGNCQRKRRLKPNWIRCASRDTPPPSSSLSFPFLSLLLKENCHDKLKQFLWLLWLARNPNILCNKLKNLLTNIAKAKWRRGWEESGGGAAFVCCLMERAVVAGQRQSRNGKLSDFWYVRPPKRDRRTERAMCLIEFLGSIWQIEQNLEISCNMW